MAAPYVFVAPLFPDCTLLHGDSRWVVHRSQVGKCSLLLHDMFIGLRLQNTFRLEKCVASEHDLNNFILLAYAYSECANRGALFDQLQQMYPTHETLFAFFDYLCKMECDALLRLFLCTRRSPKTAWFHTHELTIPLYDRCRTWMNRVHERERCAQALVYDVLTGVPANSTILTCLQADDLMYHNGIWMTLVNNMITFRIWNTFLKCQTGVVKKEVAEFIHHAINMRLDTVNSVRIFIREAPTLLDMLGQPHLCQSIRNRIIATSFRSAYPDANEDEMDQIFNVCRCIAKL